MEKQAGDKAAVDRMRQMLSISRCEACVISSAKGEKSEAQMLHNDEQVGDGTGAEWAVAVDLVATRVSHRL